MKKYLVVFISTFLSLPSIFFSQPKKTAADLFEHANKNYECKDYQGAITDYSDAIRIQPDYAEAYYGRGLTKFKLNDFQGSAADNAEAIKLKPDYGIAYYGRAYAEFKLNDTQKSLADYTEAIRLKQGFTEAYYGRG